MKLLDNLALAILIIGGLNWLLVGLLDFDLVATVFGGQTTLPAKIVYVLVGLCALFCVKYFRYVPRGFRKRDRF